MQRLTTRARVLRYQSSGRLSGYIAEKTMLSASARKQAGVMTQTRPPSPHPAILKIVQVKHVIRLIPLSVGSEKLQQILLAPSREHASLDTRQSSSVDPVFLGPVRSGKSYRIVSSPQRGLVRLELVEALGEVFERFARGKGFALDKPLELSLSRGFKANSHGHKEGRAADIDAVASRSILQWKQEWDRAMSAAQKLDDPEQQARAIADEQRRNLGYGLYKALQAHGGWRVNPGGWRVYRNVMQLFGPWTATEGPWKAMQIETPTPGERQRLADQQWVFQAHQDHIHVAR